MSIRIKFTAILLLLSLGPLTFVGFLTYSKGEAKIRENIGYGLQRVAASTLNEVYHNLFDVYRNVNTWSKLELMSDIITDDVDGRITSFLLDVKNEYKYFSSIEIADENNVIVSSTRPELIGSKLSKGNGLDSLLDKGRPLVRDVMKDSTTGEWIIAFIFPVYAKFQPDKVIGIVLARLDAKELHVVTGQKGEAIERYAIRHVMMNRAGLVISTTDMQTDSTFKINLIESGLPSAVAAISGKEDYLVETNEFNKKVLVGYSSTNQHKDIFDLKWVVLASQETEIAFAPVTQIRNSIISAAGIVIVFVIALSLYLSHKIAKPIMDLSRVAEEVSNGNLDRKVEHQSNDELGTLSRSFNQMVDNLKEQRAQLIGKEYLDSIIGNMSDALVVIDSSGIIKMVNKALLDMLEYSDSDLTGQPMTKILSGEAAILDELQGIDDVVDKELMFSTDSGTAIPVSVSGRKLHTDQRGEHDFVYVARDITIRKQVEKTLKEARDAAENATRTKSAFLANMSHEIRTPLNGVIGMTSLLNETSLNDEQQDFVNTIRTSGDTLLTVINDILDFSKIEAGKMDIETHPFELRNCVEEALDLVTPSIRGKNIELLYLVEDNVPVTIASDITRIRQILVNLLNNAVKFTQEGEIAVNVEAEEAGSVDEGAGNKHSKNKYRLKFSVSDTGIGIPKDRVDRLFSAFSQVDSSTTRKYGGTGLGLTISKRLSQMLGGDMWVESVVDHGSTFHFSILAEKVASKPKRYLRGIQPKLDGLKALIIDDNSTNLEILRRYVESWGIKPMATESIETVLEWIEQGFSFDLALLDFQMPDMDGVDLAKKIRQYPNYRELPIIILTSIGGTFDKSDMDHINAFINKPVKPSHLFNTVIGLMGGDSFERISRSENQDIDMELAAKLPLKILIAEDNAVNQKVATKCLSRLGYQADVVANGLEAIEALERQQYNIVFMDVQMPEMDGFQATKLIVKRWSRKERPWIIAMTANAMKGDRNRCLEMGMDDYVSKPVQLVDLQGALLRSRTDSQPAVFESGDLMLETLDSNLFSILAETFSDNPAEFDEILDLFEKETQLILNTMNNEVTRGELDAFLKTTHRLKGSAANLGANKIVALCNELENNKEIRDSESIRGKLVTLKAEADKFIVTLRHKREKNST